MSHSALILVKPMGLLLNIILTKEHLCYHSCGTPDEQKTSQPIKKNSAGVIIRHCIESHSHTVMNQIVSVLTDCVRVLSTGEVPQRNTKRRMDCTTASGRREEAFFE